MRSVIWTQHAVRLGFRQIKGLSQERMEAFVTQRGDGYRSVRDLWLRSGLPVADIERLAVADAFRSIGLDRRAALWEVRALDRASAAEKLPLFDRPGISLADREPKTTLPAMPPGEHVIHDYRSLGLSLKAHPVSFLRSRLDRSGVMPNEQLPSVADGRRVTVSGLVLVRQRPGKGNAIFLTLEDENGIANIIIWQRDFERLMPVIMGSRFVRVTGKLQTESGVIHIVAQKIDDLTSWLADLSEKAQVIEIPARAGDAESASAGSQGSTRRSAAAAPGGEELAREASSVMPKGRNFQ
jgi:error-prone DNA polymerase